MGHETLEECVANQLKSGRLESPGAEANPSSLGKAAVLGDSENQRQSMRQQRSPGRQTIAGHDSEDLGMFSSIAQIREFAVGLFLSVVTLWPFIPMQQMQKMQNDSLVLKEHCHLPFSTTIFIQRLALTITRLALIARAIQPFLGLQISDSILRQ
jgi:hypothetical protein